MLSEVERAEYMDEIRKEVCAHCVDRPAGGPPCGPLGKECGVELHLPELIESILQVHSPLVAPYLEHNREEVCSQCALLHSSACPCPMDYLATLIVEAVETVEEHRQQHGEARNAVNHLLANCAQKQHYQEA